MIPNTDKKNTIKTKMLNNVSSVSRTPFYFIFFMHKHIIPKQHQDVKIKGVVCIPIEHDESGASSRVKAQITLANASAEAIRMISENIQDKELPTMFLLGDRYINSLEKISQSDNSKFVIYPADFQGAIKGMFGNVFKK